MNRRVLFKAELGLSQSGCRLKLSGWKFTDQDALFRCQNYQRWYVIRRPFARACFNSATTSVRVFVGANAGVAG